MSDELAEGLMTFTVGVLRQLADDLEARLTPLCVCDQCGGHDVERTVQRAAEMVRTRANVYDGRRP